MEINISIKKQKYLKKILKSTDVKPIIQKVIDDWVEHLITTKYQSKKTLADKIDEINKQS